MFNKKKMKQMTNANLKRTWICQEIRTKMDSTVKG